MNATYLTTIVEDAWNAAVANPDIARWRSLAQMAAHIADAIEDSDPDSLMVVTHRAIYQESYARMQAMLPQPVEEERNSLSGVIVGWFRGLFGRISA